MKVGTGEWQYAIVWIPGSLSSEVLWLAQSSKGRRQVWDTLAWPAFPGTPSATQVLNELYGGCLELIERSTHRA